MANTKDKRDVCAADLSPNISEVGLTKTGCPCLKSQLEKSAGSSVRDTGSPLIKHAAPKKLLMLKILASASLDAKLAEHLHVHSFDKSAPSSTHNVVAVPTLETLLSKNLRPLSYCGFFPGALFGP